MSKAGKRSEFDGIATRPRTFVRLDARRVVEYREQPPTAIHDIDEVRQQQERVAAELAHVQQTLDDAPALSTSEIKDYIAKNVMSPEEIRDFVVAAMTHRRAPSVRLEDLRQQKAYLDDLLAALAAVPP